MGLEIGRVDHDGLRLGFLGRQAFHHPSEQTHLGPPFPAIIQCLVRPVFSGRIPPAQAIPVDEDDPAQTRRSSTPGLPWLLGKYRERRAICSSVSQYRSLILSLLAEPESHRHQPINGS